ncbi:zinc ribbon domain-containing protein [Bacillus mexicanus]|uniref:zinc ribbon domain-containing protein n=1 Tax=Bacillus mexicanus TaxID=2834415 RepID=UPI003D239923
MVSTEDQTSMSAKTFACVRFVYKMLTERKNKITYTGKVKENLPLSERLFECVCGNIMDRDCNAAINIREEGKRLLQAA